MKLGASMPPKTILKKKMEDLLQQQKQLTDYRPAVICPYCWEMHEEDNIAIPFSDDHYKYSCHECGLLINLQ